MKTTKLALMMALSAIILTGCPSGGGDPDPGSGLSFIDDSQMRVSVGLDLNESARGIKDFERILIQGATPDDTSYWVVPRPKASDGRYGSAWITYYRVEYKRIIDTNENPRVGPTIVDEYFVSYRGNGEAVITDRNGHEVASDVAGLLQWYVIREVFQTVVCAGWNYWVGIPWCVNIPLKDAPEPKATDVDQWLQLIVSTKEVCSVTWSAKYVAELDGTEETEFISGHLDMDWDADGLTNEDEIIDGTDPYDPNDPGNNRKVPGLIGKTLDEAEAALDNRDLVLGTVTYEYTSVQPVGKIFDQDPNKGTVVPKGSAVNVVVSKGVEPPNTTTVPNVVGQTLAQAEIMLADASLQTGTISYAYHPTAPVGQVIGQSPVPGTVVPVASAVNLTVSKGPEPPETTTVPNVVGKTVAEATTLLTAADLVLGTVSQAYHPTVPVGKIISQNPTSGNVVAVGSAVNVTVSLGPEPVDPLSASFTSPTNGTAFESGDTGLFKMNIVNGIPPFTIEFLFETGPIPGWQVSETSSRTPQWSVNLNSSAEPGPTNAHAYGRVTDSTGAQTAVFSVSYTVD